mgnify:CR=1 FL=1
MQNAIDIMRHDTAIPQKDGYITNIARDPVINGPSLLFFKSRINALGNFIGLLLNFWGDNNFSLNTLLVCFCKGLLGWESGDIDMWRVITARNL